MEHPGIPEWTLSDEEWCELCFMVFELTEAQQRLQEALLSDDRPSLHDLWVSGSAVQRQSHDLFSYIGTRLRSRTTSADRRAA